MNSTTKIPLDALEDLATGALVNSNTSEGNAKLVAAALVTLGANVATRNVG